MPDEPEDPDVRRLESRVVFENPWMMVTDDTVQRRDGSIGQYGVVHSADFVLVIPFDGERFHLVEQYRYPVGARMWEFPQGTVAATPTPTPERMAAIELEEETGMRAQALVHLGYLHGNYGRSTNGFHAFYATGLTSGAPAREVEEQDMRTAAFTLDEVWQLVEDGVMRDAVSLAGLALLDRRNRIA
jgi:8-oxo-dGDP phosphatase